MHKNEFNLSTAIFDKRPTVQCWSAPWNILSFKPADPSSDIFKGYSEGVPASPVQLPAGSQWSASRECAPCTAINQPQQNIQEFETSTFCKNNHFMDMSHLILLSPLLDVYSRAAWKLTCETSYERMRTIFSVVFLLGCEQAYCICFKMFWRPRSFPIFTVESVKGHSPCAAYSHHSFKSNLGGYWLFLWKGKFQFYLWLFLKTEIKSQSLNVPDLSC